MKERLSHFIDTLSDFLAPRKGLLPYLGIILILFNLFLQALFPALWISRCNLFLHLGVIVAILGIMIAWAL